MCEAVSEALAIDRSLVVQAGTGTGKTLAYLVPAALSGQRTVVATATKALQDQLAHKDLPHLAEHLQGELSFAVLKGRANYLCLQRLSELSGPEEQLGLEGVEKLPKQALAALRLWADSTDTGDRADLPEEPPRRVWESVSVSSRECPGAQRCPKGDECFAERARHRAAEADVVVVNTHLYGLDLAAEGAVLPEHDVVVFDEAHQLEDVVTATAGVELGASRLTAVAAAARRVLQAPDLIGDVTAAADLLREALAEHRGRRLRVLPDEVADALVFARGRVETLMASLREVPSDQPEVDTRKARALKLTGGLIDDVAVALEVPEDDVCWVEGEPPVLRVAPIDVSDLLRVGVWQVRTAILTSATIPEALPDRLGLDDATELVVDSPFDFEEQALLYCAAHVPDPRQPGWSEAVHDELAALIEAAGGRTLALFTSWRAVDEAAEAVGARIRTRILTPDQLPKAALLEAFRSEEETSLFATMGFWQGVDVPGASLSLVAIDRLPFARPDEPLLQARRERAGRDAFRLVDLPRATTLLAQGAGRLIRTSTDRGVVAVLDPRLATAGYRWDLIRALPPMRRTKDRAEVEAFLAGLA